MPASYEQIQKALMNPTRSELEKIIIMWQFHMLGDFHTALFDAIVRADEDNLDRLAYGFPNEVTGFRMWAYGDLGKRLRAEGLDI